MRWIVAFPFPWRSVPSVVKVGTSVPRSSQPGQDRFVELVHSQLPEHLLDKTLIPFVPRWGL
jgi:hypothetical protein